ncbi:MAG TPA: hypothetical protein VJU14_07790, partial [Solirubrobacterales bacterium]|nr:hypothetical protein [Solirubrobacterales bacterium]
EAPPGNPAAFDVSWSFECTPACPGVAGGTIPADSDPHTVEADASGLKFGTAYEVTLVATNAGGSASAGPESFTTLTTAPQILGTEVTPYSKEASLRAQVDPGGLDTIYHFEYGPTASYGQSTPERTLAADEGSVSIAASLPGLAPTSTYHFKVVVSNSLGSSESGDLTFTTVASEGGVDNCPNAAIRAQQRAQFLSECRAYEMVSPLQKNNGDVAPANPSHAAADGSGLAYEVPTAFNGAESANHTNQYIGRRTPTGWETEAVNAYVTPDPLGFVTFNAGYVEFTSDLSKGVMLTSHNPSDRSGDISQDRKRFYLWEKGVSGFAPMGPLAPSPPLFEVGPKFAGSSTDMSRVFFESEESLTPESPAAVPEAYEWHNGEFNLIGILPNGDVAPGGAQIGQGSLGSGAKPDTRPAVSGDGTQVVLTMGSPSQLYLRENGESKLISASQVSGEEGTAAPNGATFMGSSSEDGRKLTKIYFASPDPLTDDAEGDPSVFEAQELYAYDVETEELVFMTPRTSPSAVPSALVYSAWVEASSDGSYVYFIASGGLTPGAEGPQFYLWHDGELTALGPPGTYPPNTSVSGYSELTRTRVSIDGKRFLVRAEAPRNGPALTPDGPLCSNVEPNCLKAIYLYDAPADQWQCLSCNPNGPTTKSASLKTAPLGYFGLPGQQYRWNVLSSDGTRAFFETAEPLVGRDTNNLIDVYEWHEGQINLVSSGQGEYDTHFLDSSRDGRFVFIATRSRLVSQDTDNFVDAYAVRAGGGFLHEPPVGCTGDACQSRPTAAPAWAAPGSVRVAGAGNAVRKKRARCPRPKGSKGAKSPKVGKKKHRCVKPGKRRADGKGGRR